MDREDERGGTRLKKNVVRKTQTGKQDVAEDFTLKLRGRARTFGQEEEEAGAGICALRSKTEEEEKEEEEEEEEVEAESQRQLEFLLVEPRLRSSCREDGLPLIASQVDFGSWFEHIKGWTAREAALNLLHVTFEQMSMDLRGAIDSVSEFLQCGLQEEELSSCVEHSRFCSMKDNKMINYSLVPEREWITARAPS
ncbi:Sulfotransferase family cytosolic 2B member 1 [Oryzias melastigma]|uniref:Sulfotransferase n=1 Tax=Oryzias melastigma TaxID=30732 RepID=A0A834FPV3_ORYME|nr:Sulfotransferase family cytosolic 2B member 1 [Oryzias melastigma]